MTALDPALCARLVGEAREAEKEWDADAANEGKNFLPAHYVEGWNDALEAFALHLADQLEAALAEVERLREVARTAIVMRRNHEGCVTDLRCGRCFRCDFDAAVDALEAKP